MNDKRRPDVFICKPTLRVFDNAIAALEGVLVHIPGYIKINGLNAAYLYAYSVYEGALFKVYSELARAFPKNVDIALKNDYDSIIKDTSRMSVLLDCIVEDFSTQFGHKDFNHLVKQFNNIVGIDLKTVIFPEREIDEYKTNRNKLAHRGVADLSVSVVETHIKASITILKLIKEKFVAKYCKYTTDALKRASCSYLFGWNDYLYDHCFWMKDGNNCIHLDGIQHWFASASSSEKHLFMLYIANYSYEVVNSLSSPKLMPTICLDNVTLEKVSYINDLFRRYPHLLLDDPNIEDDTNHID